jgi:hypothetical protein
MWLALAMFAPRREEGSCRGSEREGSTRPNTPTRTRSRSMRRNETANPVRSNARSCALPAADLPLKMHRPGRKYTAGIRGGGRVSRFQAPRHTGLTLVGAGHDRPSRTRSRLRASVQRANGRSRLARYICPGYPGFVPDVLRRKCRQTRKTITTTPKAASAMSPASPTRSSRRGRSRANSKPSTPKSTDQMIPAIAL